MQTHLITPFYNSRKQHSNTACIIQSLSQQAGRYHGTMTRFVLMWVNAVSVVYITMLTETCPTVISPSP